MTFKVTGKNVDAGEAFQNYVESKLNAALSKYLGTKIDGHARLEKERGRFHTDCSIRLQTGLMVEARGESGDAYASADAAVEKLEARVRRYKERLKNHHNGNGSSFGVLETLARDAVLRVEADDIDDEAESGTAPVIVAESQRSIKELPVSEAVMQLDLTEAAFLLFRSAAHGGVNVVYRRADGNIGWIDPAPSAIPSTEP